MSKLSECIEDLGQLGCELVYVQHSLDTIEKELYGLLRRRDELKAALAEAQAAYWLERERGDRHAS